MEASNTSPATPPSQPSSVRPSDVSIASEELYRGRTPLVETERYRKSRKGTLIQSPSSSENSAVPWVASGNRSGPSERTSQFSRSMITVNSSARNSMPPGGSEQTSQFSRSMITVQSSTPKGDVSRNLFDDFSSRKSGSSRPSRSSRNSQAERQRLEAQVRVARAHLELAQAEARLPNLEGSEPEVDISREEK